ncbi:hypothetical protein PROPEN_04882 [Proteus penneri ATCC 35198]|nr:hypothetical protein PROPEN_04882 [Proteus penneri ATCC 35198]
MCAQRQWLSADWQEYILAHPIMHKLIEQLVWQEVKKWRSDQYVPPF